MKAITRLRIIWFCAIAVTILAAWILIDPPTSVDGRTILVLVLAVVAVFATHEPKE